MKTKKALTILEAGERIGEMVLHNQLTELHLAAFLEHYETLAHDATQAHWPFPKYLATLTQKEIDRRTSNRYKQRIKDAHFPLLKELADFDFAAIPKLNQPLVQQLASGRYLADASSVILVGAPGLGKTHLATALGLAACRQGRRVRFFRWPLSSMSCISPNRSSACPSSWHTHFGTNLSF